MDGWIILDKPTGVNSRKAGAICSRMFNAKTFGHIGTLDPMASGLLLIGLGQATKMIPFMESDKEKEYLFSVQFGFETDTLDITGKKTAESNIIPSSEQIEKACAQLTGDILQIPPNYSAIHVNGQRAHKMARTGADFEIPPRPVSIKELKLTNINESSFEFSVRCSAGTYVRSIGRDIAKLCGTLGTVDMIRRVRTNGFYIKDAVKLDFLENLFNNGKSFGEYLKPIDFGLGDIPVHNLSDKDADLYKKGGFVGITGDYADGIVRVYNDSQIIGIGEMHAGLLKPKRTIN